MLPQRPIEIKHLFGRCVEAGEQHVDHDQRLRFPLWVDESVGDLLVFEFARGRELRAVVGGRRDDGIGRDAEVIQMPGISQGGGPARCHDLRLEAVRANPRLEVLRDVEGDHLDAAFSFGHSLLVGVAAAYPRLHLVGFVAEHRLEQLVQRIRPLDGQLREPRLVQNGNRRAIGHRLRNRVRVDERAETPAGCCARTPCRWAYP